MAAPNYEIVKGNILRATFQVKVLGAFTSASSVTCETKLDGSSSSSQIVVQDGVGRYHADIDTSSMTAGEYSMSWTATGAVVAKVERRFTVTEALIP